MIKIFSILFVPVLLLTSCASIVNGPKQMVSISSYPSKADVMIDSKYVGNTPMSVPLARKEHHVVTINLEGYEPFEMVLQSRVSGWVFGNIAFGGIIGIAIDAVTGSMYRLTPEDISAELQNQAYARKCCKKRSIFVTVVLEPKPTWEKIGCLVPSRDLENKVDMFARCHSF